MLVPLLAFLSTPHVKMVKNTQSVEHEPLISRQGIRRRESSEDRGPSLDRDLQPVRQEVLLRQVRAARLPPEHGAQAAAASQRRPGELSYRQLYKVGSSGVNAMLTIVRHFGNFRQSNGCFFLKTEVTILFVCINYCNLNQNRQFVSPFFGGNTVSSLQTEVWKLLASSIPNIKYFFLQNRLLSFSSFSYIPF
jgi:hypothetical protein